MSNESPFTFPPSSFRLDAPEVLSNVCLFLDSPSLLTVARSSQKLAHAALRIVWRDVELLALNQERMPVYRDARWTRARPHRWQYWLYTRSIRACHDDDSRTWEIQRPLVARCARALRKLIIDDAEFAGADTFEDWFGPLLNDVVIHGACDRGEQPVFRNLSTFRIHLNSEDMPFTLSDAALLSASAPCLAELNISGWIVTGDVVSYLLSAFPQLKVLSAGGFDETPLIHVCLAAERKSIGVLGFSVCSSKFGFNSFELLRAINSSFNGAVHKLSGTLFALDYTSLVTDLRDVAPTFSQTSISNLTLQISCMRTFVHNAADFTLRDLLGEIAHVMSVLPPSLEKVTLVLVLGAGCEEEAAQLCRESPLGGQVEATRVEGVELECHVCLEAGSRQAVEWAVKEWGRFE